MRRRANAIVPLLWIVALFGITTSTSGGCKQRPAWEKGKKVAHLALRAKVGTLDPIRSSSAYDSEVQSQIFEGLYTYKYLVRPFELKPLLAKSLPKISEDGLTYTIDVKEGIFFHDHPCFENGKGRELVAQDFVYSIKRLADPRNEPTGWWVFQDRLAGLDDFEGKMSDRGDAPFAWDAEVEGLKATGKYQLQLKLNKPFTQLPYTLAMPYAFVLARECVEKYGKEIANHPIGTGPFKLRRWTKGSTIILDRNEEYRDARYPTEASPEYQHLLEDAGQKIPFLDSIVYHVYERDQPMWLKFRVKDLDMAQLPAEYHETVFKPDMSLLEEIAAEGVSNFNLPLLNTIYRGFNMSDPLFSGEKGKLLRQAIAMTLDTTELNDAFYNNTCVLYDGPVPPGLDSYEPGITSQYRGPKLEEARALLAKAGYPGGKGLPTIELDTSTGGSSEEQGEMFARALKRIDVNLQININSFSELSTKLKKNKAQMFSLSWSADYPDAESFLQLFYGPNKSPGSNNFNYNNPEYDALYEKSGMMQPGPARTEIYTKMRAILMEDNPSFGHMARTRFYLWHKRLRNALPNETFTSWRKYLNIKESN